MKVLNTPRLKRLNNVSNSSILEVSRGSGSVNVDDLQVALFYSKISDFIKMGIFQELDIIQRFSGNLPIISGLIPNKGNT